MIDISYFQQWVSTHEPSTEHDISIGLRENFSARKQWQSAFSKVRAAGRLNAAAIMASQRRDSQASSMTRTSGGWKNIAEEESDDEDVMSQSPDEEKVQSPSQLVQSPPGSPEVAKGPERQEEMKPTASDAQAIKETARAAAVEPPAKIQTHPEAVQDSPQATATTISHQTSVAAESVSRPTPSNGLPDINVVAATPTTPEHLQRPSHASHSSSMPGSFNGEEDDVDDHDHDHEGTEAKGATEEGTEDLWGIAARMKKIVLG